MRNFIILASLLAALIGLSITLFWQVEQSGFSAISALLVILNLVCAAQIFNLFKRQTRRADMVFRALANGDSTLGFGDQHPMQQQFEQVKQQIQAARFNAEQQAQFLQALLIHIDLAVLVCDEQGTIIESNPAVSRLLGHAVKHIDDLGVIANLVQDAKQNSRNTVPWQNGEQHDTLSVQISIAEIQGKVRKVISLQSIHDQLQLKEQQAYKRLTKVLTHEIANSITPLSSLAQTCTALLPTELSFDDQEDKQDLQLALTTLASRTEHLGEFIAQFKKVSSLPAPHLQPHILADLAKQVVALHSQQAKQLNITLNLSVQSQQLVMIDRGQVEQVIINLLTNALDVLKQLNSSKSAKCIEVSIAQNANQQLYLEVSDNGTGISDHVIEMIFVPFFTTKQQGSGIGLSLSRQIMLNHGGDLVYIKRQQGACFRCVFG